MQKFTKIFIFLTFLWMGLTPSFAQKLQIGTKGFEKVAKSIFLKEGGVSSNFSRFYKELSSSFSGQTATTRAEIRDLIRIYLNSKVSMQNARKLSLDLQKKANSFSLNMPSDVPFISGENVQRISSLVWKRDNLGTEQELQDLQKTLLSYFSKYPDKQLTLKEFYYISSKYMFEGKNSIKHFFEILPNRPFLTHITVSHPGKEPLDVFVLPNQVQKVFELYYENKPFKIEKGIVVTP